MTNSRAPGHEGTRARNSGFEARVGFFVPRCPRALVPSVTRIALLLLAIFLAGCATTPVQAWERGRLARWDMRFDPDPLHAALKQHTRFSKEGSSGSVGAAGGGCGCN